MNYDYVGKTVGNKTLYRYHEPVSGTGGRPPGPDTHLKKRGIHFEQDF